MFKAILPAIAHFVVASFILLNKLLHEVHFFKLCWSSWGGGLEKEDLIYLKIKAEFFFILFLILALVSLFVS
jgi:hypothetical protein